MVSIEEHGGCEVLGGYVGTKAYEEKKAYEHIQGQKETFKRIGQIKNSQVALILLKFQTRRNTYLWRCIPPDNTKAAAELCDKLAKECLGNNWDRNHRPSMETSNIASKNWFSRFRTSFTIPNKGINVLLITT